MNRLKPSVCFSRVANQTTNNMKKIFVSAVIGLSAVVLLSGCIAAIGNSEGKHPRTTTTLGQELMDLQKARDTGAISEADYEAQKAKLIGHK